MSLHTPNSSPQINENQDKIKLSDAFNTLELKFAETYNISLNTIQELSKFIHEKKYWNILDSSQEHLRKLQDFIDSSQLSEQEKNVLSNIPNDSFSDFAEQVFLLREEISKQKNELKESIVWWEQEDFISCKMPLGISKARYIRACNPTKPHHHLDSCIVWIYQLSYSTVKLAWSLCIDLWKACTTDAYDLITWKSQLPDYNI